jgi:twinkle protein
MELNGFQIDKWNVHALQENCKTAVCPLCSQHRKLANQKVKCLSVFWDTGLGQCNHCGERVQLHTYKSKKEEKTYSKPEWKNNTILSDRVVKWFEGRGISQFSLRMAKVGEGLEWMPQTKKNENTIQFNYFKNDELINIKYRDGAKNFKLFTGAERILYNLDCCHVSEEIIICEGEIDTLSYIECGIFNATSVPNGSTLKGVNLDYIDNSIEYFENKKKIYLALDNDEAGINTTNELIRRFGTDKCFLVDFSDCKDANEYLVKYGKEKLKETLLYAKEVPIEGVSCLNDWEDVFDDYVVNGFQRGFITGKKSLDDVFSTYSNQFIVVTGIPSSGKSEFVDEMVLGYIKNYGWKVAFASPENKPNAIHAGKLISKICGQWVNKKEYLSQIWYKQAKTYISDNFKYIDLDKGYDLDVVLDKAKSLIFKYGIKCLVIDPFNKVRLKRSLGKSVTDYTNDYLITIDDFSRDNDCLIILVMHPIKQNKDEKYEPKSLYDVKGGGEVYDMAPHGLIVHRDYDNEVTKITVAKVKFSHLGKNNAHVYYKWNHANGRYSDFIGQNKQPENLHTPIIDNTNYMIEKESNAEQTELNIDQNHKPITSTFESETDNNFPF